MTNRRLYAGERNKDIIQIPIPQTYAPTNPTIIPRMLNLKKATFVEITERPSQEIFYL
jgi:hypothetical protein